MQEEKKTTSEAPKDTTATQKEQVENQTEESKDNKDVAQDTTDAENTTSQEATEEQEVPDPLELAKQEIGELKDKYLRLYSDFENFRKRKQQERIDLIQNAGSDVLKALIPVLDDFDRAKKSIQDADDEKKGETALEGVEIMYSRLYKTLEQKGLRPMECSEGKDFDPDVQEAIGKAAAPNDELKNKILTEVEKGYVLNEKVLRYAKVIIGA
ncbi:MAG: nucleotide exchange factor GrpE [Bernardetiaceae bacterium]|nr:nucleotide exchange factor GrpE [Bernardetiaceae bacterium]